MNFDVIGVVAGVLEIQKTSLKPVFKTILPFSFLLLLVLIDMFVFMSVCVS